jgi:hypothetical protein
MRSPPSITIGSIQQECQRVMKIRGTNYSGTKVSQWLKFVCDGALNIIQPEFAWRWNRETESKLYWYCNEHLATVRFRR